MLKFKAETFFFHLVVALRVELIEECHFLVGHWERFVKLGQNAQFQHLVAEVAPVELHTEDSLIEVLQLGHGELLGQQLEADWLEVNLATQFIGTSRRIKSWSNASEGTLSSGNHWALAASSPAFTSLRRTKAK